LLPLFADKFLLFEGIAGAITAHHHTGKGKLYHPQGAMRRRAYDIDHEDYSMASSSRYKGFQFGFLSLSRLNKYLLTK
jgi:hypothetical protein